MVEVAPHEPLDAFLHVAAASQALHDRHGGRGAARAMAVEGDAPVGLVLGALGFGGVGGAFVGIAKILFFLAIALFIIFALLALFASRKISDAL